MLDYTVSYSLVDYRYLLCFFEIMERDLHIGAVEVEITKEDVHTSLHLSQGYHYFL